MTDTDADAGWFSRSDAGDAADAARDRLANGEADRPRDWPALAVESGFADSTDDYYDRLHEASVAATREAVRERERADDAQLIHAVRAINDMARKLV
ncbi:nucleolar-like protein [Halorubrum salinarum]|uniref:Nucleolar-like protein n=1 Tax=Halorubrum salinarum TaxID=2739057 RepID=A0A7D3YKG4_9EURY|nr:nucleolar-like protein [Halorubrum salinarum]